MDVSEFRVDEDGMHVWELPDGRLHRVDGPAYVNLEWDAENWFFEGELHRVGGPALNQPAHGVSEWWHHGRRHRTDGPARVGLTTGDEWWVDGEQVPAGQADVLKELVEQGQVYELEQVLELWRAGGPSVSELLTAVEAAHS